MDSMDATLGSAMDQGGPATSWLTENAKTTQTLQCSSNPCHLEPIWNLNKQRGLPFLTNPLFELAPAAVSYFDESLNTEASVIFGCRKAAKKRTSNPLIEPRVPSITLSKKNPPPPPPTNQVNRQSKTQAPTNLGPTPHNQVQSWQRNAHSNPDFMWGKMWGKILCNQKN